MEAKAQGTIEYLVIIAVVVVISLIVVGLVVTQTSSVTESDKKANNLGWKTKELQIADLAVDGSGNGTIVLSSNLIDKISIDSIVIGSATNSSAKQMFLGSTERISLENLPPCTNQNEAYTITINYHSADGLDKSVSGKFYANCIDDARILGSVNLSVGVDAVVGNNTSIISGYFTLADSNAIATDLIDDLTQGANSDSQLTITSSEIKLRVR